MSDRRPENEAHLPAKPWANRALRGTGWALVTVLVVFLLVLGGLSWYTGTSDFDHRVSEELIKTLEDATGGRVELAHTRFSLWHLAVEADGLVIHGLEGPDQAPYIAIDKLLLRVTLKNFLLRATGNGAIKYVSLDMLRVEQPHIHLIVNKDGTTNQPEPKTKSTGNEPVLDTLLNLQAHSVQLVNGVVVLNDRAVPFDLAANDLGVSVRYLSATDHYGLSLGINDLRTRIQQQPEAKSRLQVEAELGRKLIALSSLKLDTGVDSHLTASGKIVNFDHPVWEAGVQGDVEIPQVSVLSGFPGLTGGRLKLQLSGHSCSVAPVVAQKEKHFWQRRHPAQSKESTKVLPPDPDCEKGYMLVGSAKWKDAGYHNEFVVLRDVDGGAELRVTPTELLFQALTASLPGGGGSIAGQLRINNWLGEVPRDAAASSPTVAAGQKTINATAKAVNAKEPATGSRDLPRVQGTHAYLKVTLARVSLRTIMEATRSKNDLGLDTVISGPLDAEWGGPVADIASSVVVKAHMRLAPSGSVRLKGQNIPVSGAFVGEFRGDRQVVNIQQLTAKTPGTTLDASGLLGVNQGDRLTRLMLNADVRDLSEFDSILNAIGYQANGKTGSSALPVVLHGQAHFNGTASGPIAGLDIKGHLDAHGLEARLGSAGDFLIDSIVADADYAPAGISVASSTIHRGTAVLNVAGSFKPHHIVTKRGGSTYAWDNGTQLDTHVQLADASVKDVLDIAGQSKLPITGTANADLHASGTLDNLEGGGQISLRNGVAYGEAFDSVAATFVAHGQDIEASSVQVKAQGVQLTGNGVYNLTSKHLRAHAEGSNIQISNLQAVQRAQLPIDGVLTFRAEADGTIEQPGLSAQLRMGKVTLNKQALGELNADVHSQGDLVFLTAHSTEAGATLDLNGQVQLVGDYPIRANLKFANLDVNPLLKIYGSMLNATSMIAGEANLSGPAKRPQALAGNATLNQFHVTVQGIALASQKPIRASLSNGVARLDDLHITGQDTDLHASGTVQIFNADGSPLPTKGGTVDVKANGTLGLGIVHALDPDMRTSGRITFNVAATGATSKPALGGKVQFEDANLALADIPNGISKMNGTAVFTEDRLQIQDITAESGGGKVKLGGFVQFRGGLFADVMLSAQTVRIRYYGVSATLNANARLQGNSEGATLSGDVLVTRFGLAETFDFASVAGGTGDVSPPPDPDSLLNKVRLNVQVKSAPALDFQNSYAKIAGTVDLSLRGTLAVPSVLGRVTVTDGSATFAGTQYQLQRGQIYFNNPVRIDPTLDLDATARVENYDVTIGVHGTSKNFKLAYRSEPPLSQADIFNLLALGRTQEEAQINTQQLQQQGQDPTTNAILGGALNATVSSRVNKLFGGAGKVKIDPAFVGALGTSSARITVEQQLSRQVTVVFATNVNTSAQQLIQLQYQISDNKSIVATRDENGVFSMVYKIRKRYK